MDRIRPKKALGQHFLTDANIARKIVALANLTPGDLVVEIGPGKGILTERLLEKGVDLIAIEIDSDLVDHLIHHLTPTYPFFKPVLGDALRYPYQALKGPFKVVANLPYQISTPILFRLLEERSQKEQGPDTPNLFAPGPHLISMVLMVQKEVAERLAAPVGSKNYGLLSVMFQTLAEVKIAFRVPPHCFYPAPQVDSAVIQVTCLERLKAPIDNESFFRELVKGAFSHRRKMLANALADAGFPKEPTAHALEQAGILPSRRAETLSLNEFAAISNRLFAQIGK
jgi:16S rRNA (adenine1518-N6/adenine1519-N6)-dimethyltransferase